MRRLLAAAFVLCVLLNVNAYGQSPDATETDAKLPKIVLVGDSIRLSYAPIVAKQLAGTATIVSSKSNGIDSTNVLRNLRQWVIRENPTIVHFNCGIHDTKKFKSTGKFQVSPEAYEANLRKIVEQIRQETGAIVLFATTTPILDERAAALRKEREYELLGASVKQYNDIALKVMAELKTPVDDLHTTIAKPNSPNKTETLIGSDGVHMTTTGKELLGTKVAEFLKKHLPNDSE
ncbi:MAG: SGNH/GDSL hydrolase family protein [bacterium]|nr:SGNH/GDSL hydrolase family protein [bacterium]